MRKINKIKLVKSYFVAPRHRAERRASQMTQIKDDVNVVRRVQGLFASNRIFPVHGSSAVYNVCLENTTHLSDSNNDRPEWRPNPILHQIRAIVNSQWDRQSTHHSKSKPLKYITI
ncbi:unnamed protein product [Penicillium camemberti]|uniref:Str. FM013 n=1 Tax=Penicillium camemberti (strain FM 013) TaxID=1429867 RepID=A0A0G4PTY4_PENC3|nr:unnamed protein product [Penicillium camemberti]